MNIELHKYLIQGYGGYEFESHSDHVVIKVCGYEVRCSYDTTVEDFEKSLGLTKVANKKRKLEYHEGIVASLRKELGI